MAPSAKPLSLLLLLLVSLSFSHARESQFFDKVSTATNDDVVPYTKQPQNDQQIEQPSFLPENENSYGLYGQSRPSPAATVGGSAATESKQALPKNLPKNYNPVAYVTESSDDKSLTSNPEIDKYFYVDEPRNYYNTPRGGDSRYGNNNNNNNNYPAERRNRNGNNYYYNGGSSFNSGSGGAGGFVPQGMSDTRFLENGKYFYDVNTERYSSNHPYESLKNSNNNYYGNGENVYEFNGGENGYRKQDEFQAEGNNYNLP